MSENLPSPARQGFRSFAQRALLLALIGLPVASAIVVVARHAVAVPYWDDWGTPGEQLASWYRGTLTFSELLSQHNEHRRFFPRLVALLVTSVFGWDTRVFIPLLLALVGGGSAGLYLLLRRTIAAPPVRIGAFAAMNWLLFSPREYETFLDASILADLFVPAFAIVAATLMNLSACTLRMKTIVNAALALVSTYTFANGLLVWLLAFPLAPNRRGETPPSAQHGRTGWRLLYLVLAVAAIAGYFSGYRHPPLSPAPASILSQPGELLTYLLRWAGNLFLVSRPEILGSVVLLSFAVLSGKALWAIARDGEWRTHYPWLSLGTYAFISGCVTARGRLAFGYEGATHYRYTAVTVFLYIAVVGLAAALSARGKQRMPANRIWRATAATGGAVLLLLWALTFAYERPRLQQFTREREHLQLVMRWGDAIPDNPDLALLSPYRTTAETIRTLAHHDVLRPRLVANQLATAVQRPPSSSDTSAGTLEAVTHGATAGELVLKGWAALPDGNRPADCIVIGYESAEAEWKLLSVVATGRNPSDIAAQSAGERPAGAAFEHRLRSSALLDAEVTFRSWSIDLAKSRAYPMAGSARLSQVAR